MSWQKKYCSLFLAGSGNCGDAFIAIPFQTLKSMVEKEKKKDSLRDKVLSQLCVVKQYAKENEGWAVTAQIEIDALKRLSKKPGPDGDCVSRLIEADFDRYTWISTPAVLRTDIAGLLKDCGGDRYSVLLYHAFIEVYRGIRHMHSLKPAIVHGDLYPGNILVDLERPSDIPGLPRFVIIDFGNALTCDSTLNIDPQSHNGKMIREIPKELRNPTGWAKYLEFCDIFMAWRYCLNPDHCPKSFEEFRDDVTGFMLDSKLNKFYMDRDGLVMDLFWEQFGERAIAARADLLKDKEQMAKLESVLTGLRERKRSVLKGPIIEAIAAMANALTSVECRR